MMGWSGHNLNKGYYNYASDWWDIIIPAVIILAIIGGLVWLCIACFSGPSCPKGQHQYVSNEIPIVTKYGVNFIPEYACERN